MKIDVSPSGSTGRRQSVRWTLRLAIALGTTLIATLSAKAYALVGSKPGDVNSVNDRVAAIRAKAAAVSGEIARLRDGDASWAALHDLPAQQPGEPGWKKWRNE